MQPMLLAAVAATLTAPVAAQTASEAAVPPPSWAADIVVTGTREVYGVNAGTAATRTSTPLIEVPQSVEVLNRTLIEEQDRRTLTEALVNVSGVTPAKTEETVLDQPIVRGFPAEIYVDGLPAYGATAILDPGSLINVERIEVAKGPTAALYGGGVGAPLGGLIDVVSKTPTDRFGGFVSLRGGSFGTFDPSFDLNVPLTTSGAVLGRLTAEYTRADSYIDRLNSKRVSVYPTLLFKLGDATTLTLRGQYSRIDQLEYAGLPAAITVSGPVLADRNHFSGASDAPRTRIENKIVTADLSHRFSDAAEGRITARYYTSDFAEYGSFVFPAFYPPATATPTRYPLLTAYLPTTTDEVTIDANLLVKGRFLGVAHRLLLGATYDRSNYDAAIGFHFSPIGTIDFANPASDIAFGAVPPVTRTQTDRYENAAGYLQDQVDVGRLHLTGALRYTRLTIVQRESKLDRTYDRVTPRFGATFDVADGVAVFAGYSEGFRGTLNLTSAAPPVPETSQNYEAGLKLALKSIGVSGTIAAFELRRQNVPTADPSTPFASIQTGEQRARGVEADLVYEPTRSLSLLANYAYTDAIVTRDTTIPVGSRLPRVPANSGRLAAHYRWLDGALKGFALGAGLTAVDRRAITLPNSASVPGYIVFDAQAAYDIGRFTLAVSVVNVGNRHAFDPYQYLAEAVVIPIQPRSAFATLKTRF